MAMVENCIMCGRPAKWGWTWQFYDIDKKKHRGAGWCTQRCYDKSKRATAIGYDHDGHPYPHGIFGKHHMHKKTSWGASCAGEFRGRA